MHVAINHILFGMLAVSGGMLFSQDSSASVSTANPSQPTVAPVEVGKGFLQFVNATGYEGAVILSLDQQVLSSRGYLSGRSTGSLALLEGFKKIKGTLTGVGDGELALPVRANHLHLLVARVEMEEKKGKPPVPKLVLQSFDFPPQTKERPSSILMLQLTNVPLLELLFGGSAQSLSYGKPRIIEVSENMGAFPRLVFRNTMLESFNFREPAQRAVVLFTDKNGGLRTAPFSTLLP